MKQGYAVGNLLAGVGVTFNWTGGASSGVARLHDQRVDHRGKLEVGVAIGGEFAGELVMDLGTPLSAGVLALANHNLPASSRVWVSTSPDNSAWTQRKASTSTAEGERETALCFPAVSARYWRLTVFCPVAHELLLGELVLAPVIELWRSVVLGAPEVERLVASTFTATTGDTLAWFRHSREECELDFADLRVQVGLGDGREVDQVRDMWNATQGGALPLLWLPRLVASADAATAPERCCLYGSLLESMTYRLTDFDHAETDGLILSSLPREVGW